MLFFLIGAGILLCSVLLRLASALRLTIPLLYALLVPTVFAGWYYQHQALAEGIWYGMLLVTALSWAVSLVRRLIGVFRRLREERTAVRRFVRRVRKARQDGTYHVAVDECRD